jgi:hypothetical protein
MSAGRTTTIRSLRARCHGDPIARRLRIERELGSADVHPVWLPERAVLCLRRVGISGTGSLAENLREAVDRLARSAYHPLQAEPPETAHAVLFEDRAEMLACFARDWVRGSSRTRWWWPRICSSEEIAQRPVRLWVNRPEYIAAAVGLLARERLHLAFAAKLTEEECEVLTQALFRAHALPAFRFAPQSQAAALPQAFSTQATFEAPWQDAAPELSRAMLPARAQLFLGTALALYRAPAWARSAGFGVLASAWLQASDAVRSVRVDKKKTHAPHVVNREAGEEPSLDAGERQFTTAPEFEVPLLITATAAPALRTAYGGVFTLVNLAIFLGFYRDFTSPEERDDVPLLWDFVECLARELLAAEKDGDPIWTLLADLAGRPPDKDPSIDVLPGFWLETAELDLPAHADWTGLAAAIRRRLSEALDSSEAAVAGLLLRRPATVRLTPAHISIHMQLDQLPLEVRKSGLDRDPGWVPAAGRFIHFVYE